MGARLRHQMRVLSRIGARTVLAFCAALVALLALVGWNLSVLFEGTTAEVVHVGEMRAAAFERRFASVIGSSSDALNLTAHAVEGMLDAGLPPQEIQDLLVRDTEAYATLTETGFTGIYGLIDGVYLDGSGWVPEPGYDARTRPWYERAVAGAGKVELVDPYLDAQTGQVMLTVAKALEDGTSVVALDLSLDRFNEVTDDVADDATTQVVVITQTGVLVSGTLDIQPGERAQERRDSLAWALYRELLAGTGGPFELTHDGRTYQVFSSPIAGQWWSVSLMDADALFGRVRNIEATSVVAFVVFAGVASHLFVASHRRRLEAQDLAAHLRCVAGIYEAMYLIDLRYDTYRAMDAEAVEGKDALGPECEQAAAFLADHVACRTGADEDAVRDFCDLATVAARMEGGDSCTLEFLSARGRWCRCRFVAADRDRQGCLVKVLWVVELIDKERRQRDRLQYLSDTDLMTSLSNRRSGSEAIEALLAGGADGLFLLLDADRFKAVNDTYGHAVGDKVIVALADSLRAVARDGDVSMRLGGDEFCCFAAGIEDDEGATRHLGRLLDEVGRLRVAELGDARIEVSVGAVLATSFAGPTFEALYERADACMYEAKRRQGSSFELWHSQAVDDQGGEGR